MKTKEITIEAKLPSKQAYGSRGLTVSYLLDTKDTIQDATEQFKIDFFNVFGEQVSMEVRASNG